MNQKIESEIVTIIPLLYIIYIYSQSELSNQAKVNKLLEVLPTSCGRRAFPALCDLLDSGATSWLKDELQAEVKAEKGELKVCVTLISVYIEQ